MGGWTWVDAQGLVLLVGEGMLGVVSARETVLVEM